MQWFAVKMNCAIEVNRFDTAAVPKVNERMRGLGHQSRHRSRGADEVTTLSATGDQGRLECAGEDGQAGTEPLGVFMKAQCSVDRRACG